ncbi:hypothetical protein RAJCM14343_0407 [Rhodococcus aetherivorans]|jgi:hypothetical protein|uniref:Uncharacterized protein n=1 Tax=Rhodococcus aetherivorans TaxID=191292 RepID=A0ABQ0YF52_9NOCA|nr:hypothetical protein RR21198_4635 [Rhodococcus rhodochrous ATCC 21198]NCL74448.1 hypothetical protein [Rhodococcus sp. YH1]GES35160.1 hypothetical protein RAJCM14343_0407 [Rhodococcus aetherivorans]CCW11007.1 hypothetical protein EBESD8_15430 [Rhodococcus aetherivorans]
MHTSAVAAARRSMSTEEIKARIEAMFAEHDQQEHPTAD